MMSNKMGTIIDNMESQVENKYLKTIKGIKLDVYDVLKAFNVINPATQHAIKKLLMPGKRGVKSNVQDLEEAKASIIRAIELETN